MSQRQAPSASLGKHAVSRAPETSDAWGVGVSVLLAVGWAVIRLILA
jgi:hypothetical protein